MGLFTSDAKEYLDKDRRRFIVRTYRRSDRSEILEITREAFKDVSFESCVENHFGPVGGTTWQDRKCGGIDSDLTYYAKSTFVAWMDGRVVAFVTTRLYYPHKIGHVANLAVRAEWRGRGVGRALLEHALAYFRQCGMSHARIETMDTNEKGKEFYPKVGFKEVGRQIFYFMDL